LAAQIDTIFTRSRRTYGSPRVHAELQGHGVRCSRKRVARLMRQRHLVARQRRSQVHTTDSRHDQPIAPNTLDHAFTATAPNQKWVADITYIATREGWLYLAVVLDLFARRVVGWSMQATVAQELVLAAFQHACQRRHVPPGLIHHSDRGSQYASAAYRAALADAQLVPSMRRVANCWDNAVMESFFASLKAELPQEVFASHQAARSAIFAYIECFYNRQRRHSTLGYQTPVAAETAYFTRQRAA
jgi:putative transposase